MGLTGAFECQHVYRFIRMYPYKMDKVLNFTGRVMLCTGDYCIINRCTIGVAAENNTPNSRVRAASGQTESHVTLYTKPPLHMHIRPLIYLLLLLLPAACALKEEAELVFPVSPEKLFVERYLSPGEPVRLSLIRSSSFQQAIPPTRLGCQGRVGAA